jgi:hypothetical protein
MDIIADRDFYCACAERGRRVQNIQAVVRPAIGE